VAFAGKLPFTTDEARNCAVAGLTVMFRGGNWAAMSVLSEGVRAAAKWADYKGGGAAASINVVTETMTARALGEEGSADKRFDRADVYAEEGGGSALHHFQPGPVGVVESKDDARSVFTRGKVGGISKPAGGKQNFTAVANSVSGELVLKVSGRGNGAVGFTTDGNPTEDDVAETSDGDTPGSGAEWETEYVVKDRDVFR